MSEIRRRKGCQSLVVGDEAGGRCLLSFFSFSSHSLSCFMLIVLKNTKLLCSWYCLWIKVNIWRKSLSDWAGWPSPRTVFSRRELESSVAVWGRFLLDKYHWCVVLRRDCGRQSRAFRWWNGELKVDKEKRLSRPFGYAIFQPHKPDQSWGKNTPRSCGRNHETKMVTVEESTFHDL